MAVKYSELNFPSECVERRFFEMKGSQISVHPKNFRIIVNNKNF